MRKKARVKRKNRNKDMFIYLAGAVAIAIIAFSAIQQFMRPTLPRVAAADYFAITDGVILDATLQDNPEVVLLMQVRFNLTAVGGDAHLIVITVPGMVPTYDWPDAIHELRQNETAVITLPEFTSPVRCRKNADGYFEFVTSLDCSEATGRITVLLRE